MSSIKKRVLAGLKAGVTALSIVTGISSVYVVDQTEQAIVTEFGKPVKIILNPLPTSAEAPEETQRMRESYQKEGIAISEGAGLYFKIPFIQQVSKMDRRLLRWNGAPEEIPTKDKKYIWIDTTARWYINDPLAFLRTTGIEDQAQARLDDIVDSATRNAVTRRDLIEIVRTNNREMQTAEQELREALNVGTVKEGRLKVAEEINGITREACKEYGIIIYENGILIKGLTYVESVKREVENRMIAERERIAKKYLSEGEGESQRIMGEKEKELNRISSEAYKTAREIEGRADAKATGIYADAFNKDPEFYRFMRTLDLYEKTLAGEKTRLILGTDNPLLEMIKGNIKIEEKK